jgi:hypothetical protein
VGYHCADNIIEKFSGEITDEYFDKFENILLAIKNSYPKALEFLKNIDNIEYNSEEADEISNFFKEIKLNFIFVDEQTPLTKYGNICYSVYFKTLENVYALTDFNDESDYSYMYLYFENNPPILRKINLHK